MLSKMSKLVGLISSVLFLSVLKYVVDQIAEALPQILRLVTYVSLPITGGFILLSFCSLLGSSAEVESSATSHLLRRVSEDPARNFFIGFLLTAYLNLVRPPLAGNVFFLPYLEWVAIALAFYVMYSMAGFSAKELYVGSVDLGWKKHIQEIKRETGTDLIRITSFMEQFVDQGIKEGLIACLTSHLQRLGETGEDILKILSPLINYQGNERRSKQYFLTFRWAKRKLVMRKREARENLLITLLEKIDRLRSE